jgi:hypothetical protein
MAEIKSTLDIILEKAKKFTVTEEEKKGFRRQELEGKIRGLIQKYVDGIVGPEKFNEEVRSLRGDDPVTVGRLTREEAMVRIRLGEDNQPLLEILSATGMDTKPVKELLRTFQSELKRKRERCENVAREKLVKKGISGSAVVPNLNADEGWRKTLSETEEAFKEKLRRFC